MVSMRLPMAVFAVALSISLPGCGGKSLNRGDSGASAGGSSGGGGASGVADQAPRISSPLAMDLSRPAEDKLAPELLLTVRRNFEKHAKTFMAPSHGQWLAAAQWPHYQDCAEEYRRDLKIEASGDTMTVKGTVDASDCIKTRNEPAENAQIQVYAKLMCPGKDLGALNGEAITELSEMPCANATDVQFINQSIVDIKTKVRVAGIVPFDLVIKEQHSFADGNGQGCHYKGSSDDLAYARECVAVTKISQESPYKSLLPAIGLHLNKVSFFKATFKDLPFVADGAKPWYESRVAAFEMNGWNGDVTYQGVDSGPKFEAKKGNAKIDGTL